MHSRIIQSIFLCHKVMQLCELEGFGKKDLGHHFSPHLLFTSDIHPPWQILIGLHVEYWQTIIGNRDIPFKDEGSKG